MPAVGKPRKNAHPDGWSSARIEQAPKKSSGGTPDGYPLGKTNEQRAARATVKAVLAKLRGKK